MLDMKLVVKDPCTYSRLLRARDPDIDINPVIEKYLEKNSVETQFNQLRHQQKLESTKIANMTKGSEEFEKARNGLKDMASEVSSLRTKLSNLKNELEIGILGIPNIILPDVPVSQNKEDKVVIKESGPKKTFDFYKKDHMEIVSSLGIMDFERSAKIVGKGFPLYVGKGAQLELALINFMVDHNINNGFKFMIPPLLSNAKTLTAAGNLPKFEDQLYKCEDEDFYLIPTSEVPLTGYHLGEILNEDDLPLRYTAFSTNFRREGDLTSRKNRGLMRLRHFNKIETFSITAPENSGEELEKLVDNAEDILEKLDLEYRSVILPSCDLAYQSAKTIDIEIWLPFDEYYSEVSSASNCLDYQARRAMIRYRDKHGIKGYVHTLNCSALATPRVMIALLESQQTKDGHVIMPEALRKYTGFDII